MRLYGYNSFYKLQAFLQSSDDDDFLSAAAPEAKAYRLFRLSLSRAFSWAVHVWGVSPRAAAQRRHRVIVEMVSR